MQKKIIGIVICMLVFATTLPVVGIMNKAIKTTSYETDDVPVWEVGDSWTYEIERTVRSDPNGTMNATGTGDLVLTVVDDTGDYYTLEGIANHISMIGNIGKIGIKSSRIAKTIVDLVVRKSDLAISSHNIVSKGIIFMKLGPIPIPFPIQMGDYRNSKFTPDRPTLPFPLFDGKNGNYSSVLTEEEWATTLFWGLINLGSGNNSWYTAANDYTCTAEQITVPAGTYDVYNVAWSSIHFPNELFFYYNSTVGNVVKQTITMYFGDSLVWWQKQEYQLISTTYTP